MLHIENLNAWYDRSHVLQGISLQVNKGEIVTLMGRNGAGKTTTLRSLMGLLSKRQGKASIDGTSFLDLPAHERFHLGLAYVPEDRRIVPGLTVKENLELGLIAKKNRGDMAILVDEIAETFPRLKERLHQDGTSMSGGEQQMLAIARAMIAKPKVILLDEPSEGIMPVLVDPLHPYVGLKAAIVMLLSGGLGLVIYKVLKTKMLRERPFIGLIGIECAMPPLDQYRLPLPKKLMKEIHLPVHSHQHLI